MHDDVDITSTNETFANNLNDIIVSIFDTGGDLATSTNLQRETVLRGAEARLSGWREVLFKGKKNKKGSIPFLSFGTKITNCAVSKGGLGGLTPPQRVFLVVCLVRKGLEKGAEPNRRAHLAGVNRAYLSVRSPMRDGSSDPQEEPDLLWRHRAVLSLRNHTDLNSFQVGRRFPMSLKVILAKRAENSTTKNLLICLGRLARGQQVTVTVTGFQVQV